MPALLGSVEVVEGDAQSALAIVHSFVSNQGDGWVLTSGYLDRYVDEQRLLSGGDQDPESEEQTAYARYMQQTGKRVAEMQVALASRNDIDAFKPEAITPGDVDRWINNIMACAERVFSGLQFLGKPARDTDRALIDELVKYQDSLRPFLEGLLPRDLEGLNIRHHGDLHLGQLLIVKDDIFIIDFEGEPRRSLDERRR
jgi:maltose alpha-D-glucosyltransferase/alpha-amylase